MTCSNAYHVFYLGQERWRITLQLKSHSYLTYSFSPFILRNSGKRKDNMNCQTQEEQLHHDKLSFSIHVYDSFYHLNASLKCEGIPSFTSSKQ